MQLVSYNFAEKYNSGGVIGVLASDRVQLGDIVVGNASLGLVTEASVDLTGASCAGVLVCHSPYRKVLSRSLVGCEVWLRNLEAVRLSSYARGTACNTPQQEMCYFHLSSSRQ